MDRPIPDVLRALDGQTIGDAILRLMHATPGRFVEETNFELVVVSSGHGAYKRAVPIARGKYFGGRGRYYPPWLEVYVDPSLVPGEEDVISHGLVEVDIAQLFGVLGKVLPPGGRIMVPYRWHGETQKGLERGFPAPATPLGFLLWHAGFTWFKDWYFSEGFWEGDVKLQGNKARDASIRKKHLHRMRDEINRWLSKKKGEDDLSIRARARAQSVLASIDDDTASSIQTGD